jgi:PAS domain S-box-containing protein
MGRELNRGADRTVRRTTGRGITDGQKAEEALRIANENLRVQAEQLWTLNNALQLQRTELEASNENLRAQEQELRGQAEALRESEERYRTLFETAPDGIVVHRDDRFLAANDAALRLTGAGRFEDLANRTVSDFLRPREKEQAAEQAGLAAAGPRTPVREATLVRWDGQEVAVEFHTASVDFQGAPAVQTIIRDITERRRAEESLRNTNESLRAQTEQLRTLNDMLWARQEELKAAHADLRAQQRELRNQTEELRDSQERLALAISGTRIGMYERNLATGRTLCTEQAARLLGLRTTTTATATTLFQECHYHEWIGRIHPDDLPRVAAALHRRRAERSPGETEYRVLWADGSVHWIADRSVFHGESDGASPRMLGIVLDITERKPAQETLHGWDATLESRVAQRTVELEQRARDLQELMLELSRTEERERRRVAVILHEDLQQQIAGAKFYLDSLSHQVRSTSSKQTAAEISRLLRTAIGMSRNLSHELSPAIFYGNDLAEAIEWLAEHLEADQGLTVRVDAGDKATLKSEALALFLFRATSELLSNVVRHGGIHEARVRLRRVGRCVGLGISDRGRGFDPQECRDTARFGLLGIRERVELLGGRVKIASAKGRGTKVRIVVPDAGPDQDTPVQGQVPVPALLFGQPQRIAPAGGRAYALGIPSR